MNDIRPKLHIVLTAKAKHAEFKCPLCKKLFISEYHLNRHKSRRHSHHYENVTKEQEQEVQYRNALEERIRRRQAVDASHRMEKLLRNLNLEETHLIDKSKQLNSSNISYGANRFPCVSVLTPINSNTNILENSAFKKIKTSDSSCNIKCKENNDSKFMSHAYTWVTSRDLGSGDTKEICFFNEKACQTEVTSKVKKRRNDFNNYDDKLVSMSLVKGTQTDEVDAPFISKLENLFPSNVDQESSVLEFVSNNYTQSETIVTTAHISTQTDEVIYRKNCTYTQTCRLRENAINFDEGLEIERIPLENNALGFDKSVVIAYSSNLSVANRNEIDSIINKDYLTFEKEFQKSFKARKNLLENDDLMLCSDNLNDISTVNVEGKLEPESDIEQISVSNTSDNKKFEFRDSFETKKNLSSNNNMKVFKSSIGGNVSDVKCPSESLENSDNLITQISAINESNNIDEIYLDGKNNQERINRTDKRHEDILQNIQDELSARLRSLGVDPEWSGISDIIAKKTNAILTVRRINLSKKIPRFLCLRTMLNNTIDQILEAKECGNNLH
ncbi:hypothetical protein O3M35_008430 [Rhynocoris fuscipes]|uniref:C2H2-type domain-containing protein n=1 Tax=Rhynocoris fuscipes TaxID=488301 RepID=A0AAW1DDN8_9HEMI